MLSLDDGARDAKVRKEPDKKDKEDWCCSGCGYIMPQAAKTCPSCGREHHKQSKLETLCGIMVEVAGSRGRKKKGPEYLAERYAVWLQLCGYVAEHKKGDHEAARKFARTQYQRFYHERPKFEYAFYGQPIGEELKRQVMRNVIAYAKAQGGQRARLH